MSCVGEGSYNTMFGLCISICIVLIILTAFYTHSLTKIDDGTSDPTDPRTLKHISQAMLIAAIVFALVVIFLFFGNSTRMQAVYSR